MIKSNFLNNNGVLILKFSNPKTKNAFALEDYKQMTKLLNEAAVNDEVKITVLTGEGDHYSSGNNLSSLIDEDEGKEKLYEKAKIIVDEMKLMIDAFIEYPKPLIAIVNGPCFGIAATTIALCDVIYAHESSFFCTPFSRWGVCVEGCASYTFPRILGYSKASEMILFCHKLTAKEAKEYNFVSQLYGNAQEEEEIWKKIEKFTKFSLESLKTSKNLMRKFDKKKLKLVNEEENDEFLRLFVSDDSMNAIKTFKGRKPKVEEEKEEPKTCSLN